VNAAHVRGSLCLARKIFGGLRHLIAAWTLRIPIVAATVAGLDTVGRVAVAVCVRAQVVLPQS